jgi:pimeloyl-ACP methyl ester carboxylesterase
VNAFATSSDGIPISYEARGAGAPALVFVHGWSCDRSYWSAQLDHFAERHRVVAIDLAGHGASGEGRPSWTMPAFGGDVVAVADDLGLEQMVLIGHSMGGDVIVEAAVDLPGRVRGLVWVDVYSDLGEPTTSEELERFLAPFREDFVTTTRDFVRRIAGSAADPDLVERIATDMSSAPPEIAIDAVRHARGNEPAVLARLPELSMPIVAINPERSTGVDGLRSHGVDAVLMPGVGHFMMQEDPDGFNRILRGVIEDLAK